MAAPRNRTVVIGLDGATWDLLDSFFGEGVLPNLERLRREGAWGKLRSVVPPMTATAWTSSMTGKGPGKHGIYDWTEPVGGSYLYRPIDSTRVMSRTLFEQLSERGQQICTVNLPLTWPARPINGIAVGDMLTPSKESPGFTHPPSFKAELDRLVPDYQIDTHLCEKEGDLLPFLARLRTMLEGRGTLVRQLMERQSWDLCWVVWVEMDRMQHCLWHIFDRSHPYHDEILARRYREPILDIYRLLDVRVGEMLERRPAGSNVFFLSDHGFGPCRYKVFLNTWLAQEAFFSLKKEGNQGRQRMQRLRGLLDRAGLDTRRIIGTAKKLGLGNILARNSDSLSRFAADIDWENTQAFCHGTNAIRINLRGRERYGSVDPSDYDRVLRRLKERLLAMRDPEGNPVIQKVQTREELYSGPYVEGAADLLISDHDDSVWFYYSEGEVPEEVFERSGWSSGNHKPDGIFLAWGPDIRPGEIQGAHINDFMPTILASMGVPIPDDVDGRPLAEIFDRRSKIRPLFKEATLFQPKQESGHDAATNAAIEDRLRGLGYLQ